MANYKHVYLGPFLKVKIEYHDGEVTERSCTKKGCKNYDREYWGEEPKFCDLCGSPIDKVNKIKRVEKVNHFSLMDDIKEALWIKTPEKLSDIYTYMMPNMARGEKHRSFDLDVQWQEYIIDGKHIDKVEETIWFTTQFATEIEYIMKQCGVENVEVTWGLFTYVN